MAVDRPVRGRFQTHETVAQLELIVKPFDQQLETILLTVEKTIRTGQIELSLLEYKK